MTTKMVDLLTEEELEIIRADLRDILEDEQYSVKILYRRLVSQSVNLSTGVPTKVIVDTEIRAVTGSLSIREVANSGGLLQVGDVFFLFDPAKLPAYPEGDDQILQEVVDCGHLRLVQNSAAVVGYNTTFQQVGVQGGDVLMVGSTVKPIANVTSDTALALKSNWTAATEQATEFRIFRVYEIVQQIIDPLTAACRINARRAGS